MNLVAMTRDRRLEWVQANRARKDRERTVGPAVNRLVKQIESVWTAAQAVASAIGVFVDDEFRDHCRIAVTDGRTLVVNVDSAPLVYPMRLRWLLPLQRALSGAGDGYRIDKIMFEFGTAGVRVNGSGDSRDAAQV